MFALTFAENQVTAMQSVADAVTAGQHPIMHDAPPEAGITPAIDWSGGGTFSGWQLYYLNAQHSNCDTQATQDFWMRICPCGYAGNGVFDLPVKFKLTTTKSIHVKTTPHTNTVSSWYDIKTWPMLAFGTVDVSRKASDLVYTANLQSYLESDVLVSAISSDTTGVFACYATEHKVRCVQDSAQGIDQDIMSVSWPFSIRSIARSGASQLMITQYNHQTDHTTHEFWSTSATQDTSITFDSNKVLTTTTAHDYTRWTLTREASQTPTLHINRGDPMTRFADVLQDDTTKSRYETQMRDMPILSFVLTVSNTGNVFVLTPLIAQNSDVIDRNIYLVARMYSATGQVTSQVDRLVDPSWSFSKIANHHVSYTSRYWVDESRVVVGFMGEVFLVSCDAVSYTHLTLPTKA